MRSVYHNVCTVETNQGVKTLRASWPLGLEDSWLKHTWAAASLLTFAADAADNDCPVQGGVAVQNGGQGGGGKGRAGERGAATDMSALLKLKWHQMIFTTAH